MHGIISLSVSEIVLKRVFLPFIKFEMKRKKMKTCFDTGAAATDGLILSKKLIELMITQMTETYSQEFEFFCIVRS